MFIGLWVKIYLEYIVKKSPPDPDKCKGYNKTLEQKENISFIPRINDFEDIGFNNYDNDNQQS